MSEKWNRPGRYYKTLPAQHPHRWHKPERSPLFAVAAILIKPGSPGPVFFVQERLGLNKGSVFTNSGPWFKTPSRGPRSPIRKVENLLQIGKQLTEKVEIMERNLRETNKKKYFITIA